LRIRYLLMNAFSAGGTVRTTLQTAAALAERHDVEVVSIYKRRDDSAIPHDPRLRVRVLVDESPAALAARTGPLSRATEAIHARLRARPSRLVHTRDLRYENFSALTDLALYRYLRAVRTDVLVGTRPGLNLAMARHAPRSIVRVGQDHLHIGTYPKELRTAMRRLYPNLDLYVTLTERDAEAWREILPRGPRVVSVPNAVPDTGAGRSPLTDKVVIAAGRLTWQKGFGRLIPIWRQVADEHPDWTLRIFGDGYREDKLRSLIAEHRLEGTVQLMGHSSRLHDEMRRASIFVMPSRFEGFPMILLEAMSCGLPPVVYDFPNGARELVTDEVNGRLIPDRDAEGMARALSQLMSDEGLRRRLAQQAAATVDGYRLDTLVARWEEIFGELVEARADRLR
jgi:glycosyltransferase involved in cell wall biosynthesis